MADQSRPRPRPRRGPRHRPQKVHALGQTPENLKERAVKARHKVGTIAGPMALSLAFFSGTASAHTASFNQRAASYVQKFIGTVPYTYGGTSPSSGFDC